MRKRLILADLQLVPLWSDDANHGYDEYVTSIGRYVNWRWREREGEREAKWVAILRSDEMRAGQC